MITLDSRGIIRTLDTNITWTLNIDNNRVSFILSRDRVELGRIVINGETITSLETQY